VIFHTKPNVVVEWLTFLLHIKEVPGSNFGPETGYPDWVFSWFSSVPSGCLKASPLWAELYGSVQLVCVFWYINVFAFCRQYCVLYILSWKDCHSFDLLRLITKVWRWNFVFIIAFYYCDRTVCWTVTSLVLSRHCGSDLRKDVAIESEAYVYSWVPCHHDMLCSGDGVQMPVSRLEGRQRLVLQHRINKP
jgi:hypothetical protein